MTTILNLPEEILLLIFKELFPRSRKECQYVCKAWYLPAHKLNLERILVSFDKISRFNSSIDYNPDPRFLNAVKVMNITAQGQQKRCLMDTEMIEKLFYRFPNLKDVYLQGSSLVYDGFNDDICVTILKKCPKLESFKIHKELHTNSGRQEQYDYLETHFKIRLLLTEISLYNVDFSLHPESLADFISRFPRLKILSDVPTLNNFQKILPAFGQLQNLTTIHMEDVLDDQDNFAETYLTTITQPEQEQLMKVLSSVKCLDVYYRDFGVNSLTFIAKYFTGLQSFTTTGYHNQTLTNHRQNLLLNTIVDLVCTAKNKGEAYFNDLKLDDLSGYLPSIISKISQNPSSTKVLEVKTKSEIIKRREKLVQIKIDASNSIQKIIINVSCKKFSLSRVATILSSTHGIDSFIINIDNEFKQRMTKSLLDEIFTTMPSVKYI